MLSLAAAFEGGGIFRPILPHWVEGGIYCLHTHTCKRISKIGFYRYGLGGGRLMEVKRTGNGEGKKTFVPT